MIKVELLRYTNDADGLIGQAAAKCTNSKDYKRAMRGAISSGHDSVAEHAVFTFEISGVSRVLLAQITRHRLASFSVQSQRYAGCKSAREATVIPPSFEDADARCRSMVRKLLAEIDDVYGELLKQGVPEEDARFLMPQGIETTFVMTMNARELKHFFKLRCCNRAQWEIRQLAEMMLAIVKTVAPETFRNSGAPCEFGKCPEKRPCGHPKGVRTDGREE